MPEETSTGEMRAIVRTLDDVIERAQELRRDVNHQLRTLADAAIEPIRLMRKPDRRRQPRTPAPE